MRYFLFLCLFPNLLMAQKTISCPDSVFYQLNTSINSKHGLLNYLHLFEKKPNVYAKCGEILIEEYFEICEYQKIEGLLYILQKKKNSYWSNIANSLLCRLDINNKKEVRLITSILSLLPRNGHHSKIAVEIGFKLLSKGNIISTSYHPWFNYLLWVGEQEEHQDVLIQLEFSLVKNDFYGVPVYQSYEKILKEKVNAIKRNK